MHFVPFVCFPCHFISSIWNSAWHTVGLSEYLLNKECTLLWITSFWNGRKLTSIKIMVSSLCLVTFRLVASKCYSLLLNKVLYYACKIVLYFTYFLLRSKNSHAGFMCFVNMPWTYGYRIMVFNKLPVTISIWRKFPHLGANNCSGFYHPWALRVSFFMFPVRSLSGFSKRKFQPVSTFHSPHHGRWWTFLSDAPLTSRMHAPNRDHYLPPTLCTNYVSSYTPHLNRVTVISSSL